jgi:hypothetical protein
MNPKPEILEEFIACELPAEIWVGYAPHAFIKRAFSNPKDLGFSIEHLSECALLRKDIFEHVNNRNISDFECLISILAWGQIRYNNLRYAAPMFAEICKIIKTLRTEPVDRRSAYKMFIDLRSRGLKGIGPAYFTKIIYFCTQKSIDRGYILDQWTGRSTNLIFAEEVVILDKFSTLQRVSDKNSEKNYDNFCRGVEILTEKFKRLNEPSNLVLSSDEVERKMFSSGGRKKGSWREFVLSHT